MSQPTTEWPYDAQPGEVAERYRIPLITTLHPHWRYLLCVIVSSDTWGGLMPTDAELRLIRSYLDFKLSKLPSGIVRETAALPFDINSRFDPMILLKRAEGDWCFRMYSWPGTWKEEKSLFYPSHKCPLMFNLSEMLDYHERLTSSNWKQWQAKHPLV